MNKSPADWSRVSVEAVLSGSPAQAANVLRMALEDIAEMAAYQATTAREHGIAVADAFDRGFERGRQEKNDG